MSLESGIYDAVPSADYHAPDSPTLSASIANLLLAKSPRHAWTAHPALNPDYQREESDKFDLGICAHALFLQGSDIIAELPYPDWRSKDARAQRDAVQADGRIPLLPEQADRVRAMVAAAAAQLRDHNAQPPLFASGKAEQTLVWEDDHGVVCRARLDWLRDDFAAIDDLKTTSASAAPGAWVKTAYGMGCDVQVAFYERGVEKLTGVRPVFRYAVCETYPPYALSVVDLAPSAIAFAREKVQAAIEKWSVCLEQDFWPAYPSDVASVEIPTWAEFQWLESQETAA